MDCSHDAEVASSPRESLSTHFLCSGKVPQKLEIPTTTCANAEKLLEGRIWPMGRGLPIPALYSVLYSSLLLLCCFSYLFSFILLNISLVILGYFFGVFHYTTHLFCNFHNAGLLIFPLAEIFIYILCILQCLII